jgi:hypothetical protein
MRMKKLLSLILFYVLINSCTKDVAVQGSMGPQGPAGPAGGSNQDTGTINGTAFLYDEFSFGYATQNGVVVTLMSGQTRLTDSTDTSGQYQFHGIPTGTYNMSFAIPGFGTVYRYGISHFAGGNLPTEVPKVDLVQVPVKTAIDSMSFVQAYGGYVVVTISLDTSSLLYVQYGQNFQLLVGKTAAVGPTNFVKSYGIEFNPDGLGNYTLVLSKSDVASFFNTGDTMYVTACTYNRYLHLNNNPIWIFDDAVSESYVDPTSGYVIFPSARFSSTILKPVY